MGKFNPLPLSIDIWCWLNFWLESYIKQTYIDNDVLLCSLYHRLLHF